jgi:protoporphyrinogen/coproporphyrinogen III oxidase
VKVAIVGGGISGLSAAYELHKSGVEFTLFESSTRLGGVIRTERVGDFLLEAGPDSFLTEKSAARELCVELGLESELIGSNDARRKTYVLVKNKLVPLPDGLQFFVPTDPVATFFSPLFPFATKLKFIQEWFASPPAATRQDESVADFVTRHFGADAVDRLADPLLSGVYGGQARELSAHAVLPRMAKLEAERGSLIRGMMATRKQNSGQRPAIFTTLKGGMQQLVDAIVARLPASSLKKNCEVTDISRSEKGWRLRCNGEFKEFDALVLAVPATVAGRMMQAAAPDIAGQLQAVCYGSSLIVQFAFAQSRAPGLPQGFGVLVPRTENKRVRAITFVHEKFDGRVPGGGALLRMFLGGTADQAVLQATDEEIIALVKQELLAILNIREESVATRIFRWPQAMAQYEVGHLTRVQVIERRLRDMPTLALAGNAYNGIGVPDCIRSGREAAQKLLPKK